MRRLSLVVMLVCATGLLAACQVGKSTTAAAAEDGVTPNAVAGDAIEVTALDAPASEASAPETGTKPAEIDAAAPQASPATVEPEPAAAETAPTQDIAETPATPKSEMQLACEKKKGRWSGIGKGHARACVFQTKDAGKRCEKESQCDGVCLARSGTCSPFKPLYGCNEILQDNGARVTLCLD